jgi:tetratricopeptide (TPR) repeat protein
VLPKEVAERVGRHLVAAGRLLDHDPDLALQHAQAARVKAPRFGIVREAVGEAAYHTGDWHMALMELRAARRVTGNDAYLPMIIDCERALGRSEKARQLLDEARKGKLDIVTRVELAILSAGIHRENGDTAAAIADVSLPELRSSGEHSWLARLRYCYAELLLERDQLDQAKTWFGLAADADDTDETDAADRLLELEGVALGEDIEAGVEPEQQNPAGV